MRFFGVNFILQKFCSCKKNDKYQVWVKLDYFQYYLERIDGVLKNRGDGVGGWGGLVLREGDMFGENIFSNIFFCETPNWIYFVHNQNCKCSLPQAWIKGWYHDKNKEKICNKNYDCKCGGKRIIKVMTKINGPCSPTSFSRRAKHT